MALDASANGSRLGPWTARVGAIGVLVLVAAVLSGCVPTFDEGAGLAANPHGTAMRIEWPAATDPDGGSIESYRIDVDGVEVARRSASLRRCDLAGLAAGPHEVTVTAYDTAGEWSGSAATAGTLTATVTPIVVGPEAAEPGCQPVYDTTVLDVGTGKVIYLAVSGDGRSIAFITDAGSVPDGGGTDANGTFDVFYRDLGTGITHRITDGDARSDFVAISDDGRYVAFSTAASNVVVDDTNARSDVFVWDRATSASVIVAPGSGSAGGDGLSISGDGRFVGYTTTSALDPLDVNGREDAYLWDRVTGTAVLSPAASGWSSLAWDVSRSGRTVIYQYSSADHPPAAYLWDRTTGERLVLPEWGTHLWPRASDDGQVVVYSEQAVYRWERATGVATALTQPDSGNAIPMVSSDGSVVVFPSRQSDLTGAPPPATNSLALHDARTGSTAWIGPAGGPTHMSRDASVIARSFWPGQGIAIMRRIG